MQRLFTQFSAFCLLLGMLIPAHGASNTSSSRVIMVVSGYGEAQGKERPGYEFDEFAKAYLVFNVTSDSKECK